MFRTCANNSPCRHALGRAIVHRPMTAASTVMAAIRIDKAPDIACASLPSAVSRPPGVGPEAACRCLSFERTRTASDGPRSAALGVRLGAEASVHTTRLHPLSLASVNKVARSRPSGAYLRAPDALGVIFAFETIEDTPHR